MADAFQLDVLPAGFTLSFSTADTQATTAITVAPAGVVAVLRKLGFPKFKRGATQSNDLQSLITEKIMAPGFFENEPIGLGIRYRDTDYQNLANIAGFTINAGAQRAGLRVQWMITLPLLAGQVTAPYFSFYGWIMELGLPEKKQQDEERLDIEFVVKPDIPYWASHT